MQFPEQLVELIKTPTYCKDLSNVWTDWDGDGLAEDQQFAFKIDLISQSEVVNSWSLIYLTLIGL